MEGRLHTRYAPVRRSLSGKPDIPLDLHVLGLPLAFILSQDQTLHRIILICFGNRQCGAPKRSLFFCPRSSLTGALSIQYVYELVFFFSFAFPIAIGTQSGCKSNPFFKTNKKFFKNFPIFFPGPKLAFRSPKTGRQRYNPTFKSCKVFFAFFYYFPNIKYTPLKHRCNSPGGSGILFSFRPLAEGKKIQRTTGNGS